MARGIVTTPLTANSWVPTEKRNLQGGRIRNKRRNDVVLILFYASTRMDPPVPALAPAPATTPPPTCRSRQRWTRTCRPDRRARSSLRSRQRRTTSHMARR
ncbi:hypothetical protein ON010_g8027 [Phytophthora cinnamomi]|nr:hypothetical protein ON010_g8027 [Phytophthora cinnamomi]